MSEDRNIPYDSIPETGVIPSNWYELEIEGIEETHTREAAKLMYKASLRVTQPNEFEGVPLWENFVVGNDDDPDARDPKTWMSFGSRRFKTMLKKSGVPSSNSMSKLLQSAEGRKFMAFVTEETDDRGEQRNRISRFETVGTRQPGSGAGQAAGGVKGAAGAAQQAASTVSQPGGGSVPRFRQGA